jgi:hypothetical protein
MLQRIFKLGKFEETIFNIKLYSLDREEIFTNCLIVDSNKSLIYLSPLSKSLILNNTNIE